MYAGEPYWPDSFGTFTACNTVEDDINSARQNPSFATTMRTLDRVRLTGVRDPVRKYETVFPC